MANKTEAEIIDEHFGQYMRYSKGIVRALGIMTEGRKEQTKLIVLWGASGTGKSQWAQEYVKDKRAYYVMQPTDKLWWDGYDGHEVIIIDEFYGWIRRAAMQRLVDKLPYKVETKGGSVDIRATLVIITSNQDPTKWWKMGLEDQMERRMAPGIGEVYHVTAPLWEVPLEEQRDPRYAEEWVPGGVRAPPPPHFIAPPERMPFVPARLFPPVGAPRTPGELVHSPILQRRRLEALRPSPLAVPEGWMVGDILPIVDGHVIGTPEAMPLETEEEFDLSMY